MGNYWIIRNKKTGHIIPEPKSVGCSGYTHVSCNGNGIPRLLPTEAKAKGALREWLKGVHTGTVETDTDDEGWGTFTYSYTIIEVEKQSDRVKEDMEVVCVTLKEVIPNE